MPGLPLFVDYRDDFLFVSSLADLNFALQTHYQAWIVFLGELLAFHCIEEILPLGLINGFLLWNENER